MEKRYNVSTNIIGRAGELRVASELMLRKHIVYMPSVDNGIDVVLGNGKRIQIKCGQKHIVHSQGRILDKYIFNFKSSVTWKKRVKHGDSHHVEPHKLKDVDFIILWAIDDDDFYIIPAEKVRGTPTVSFTADEEKRTQVKWNKWLPYRNNWGLLNGETVEVVKLVGELECKQCGHKWLPLVAKPTRCPNCNRRWYQGLWYHTCKRCGHTWHSRVEIPNWCSKCNSKVWDKEKTPNERANITCVHCGYTWQPEVDNPNRCPKCKTRRFGGVVKRECKQCGHVWWSYAKTTYYCPKCLSSQWYKEKELVLV